MQQGEPPAISLGPGGGGSGNRLFVPRFSSSSSFDLTNNETFFNIKRENFGEYLRFTQEALLQLKESLQISDEILRHCEEIAAELFDKEQSWGNRATENKTLNLPTNRYSA